LATTSLVDLEHVILRIRDLPAHRIGEVDDVLVARQHQIFRAGLGKILDADILHVHLHHARDRRGHRHRDAGIERPRIAAEVGHHAAFLRRDRVDRGVEDPDEQDDPRPDQPQSTRIGRHGQPAEAAAAAIAAAATAARLLQEFVERRRLVGGLATARRQRPGVARATALIVIARSPRALRRFGGENGRAIGVARQDRHALCYKRVFAEKQCQAAAGPLSARP
jgi:hypothetical protein